MTAINRRKFVQQVTSGGAALAAGVATLSRSRPGRAAAPSETVNLAVIGIHGRGTQLAQDFAARDDCQVACLCDVDASLLADAARVWLRNRARAPRTVQDFRRALDDPDVDAVVIATPDHWHALATIWAVQASKDVYVEKPHQPLSLGRPADGQGGSTAQPNRTGRHPESQRALQYRSAGSTSKSGKLGTIHMVKVMNQKYWPNLPPTPTVRARRTRLGHVERSGARSRPTTSTTTTAGTTFGVIRAATSSTTACTSWTWPAI